MPITDKGLGECLISPNEADRNMEAANVVDGLFAIARGLGAVADAINKLGMNDAMTPMGAIEALSKEIRDGFTILSSSLDGLADDAAE